MKKIGMKMSLLMGLSMSFVLSRIVCLSLFLFGSVLFTVYGLVGSAWKRLI